MPLQPARPEQCIVQHVRAVGCCQYRHVLEFFHAVQFREDLRYDTLGHVRCSLEGTALRHQGIDLIEEDDRR